MQSAACSWRPKNWRATAAGWIVPVLAAARWSPAHSSVAPSGSRPHLPGVVHLTKWGKTFRKPCFSMSSHTIPMTPTSLKRDWRIHITYYSCIFCVYIAQVVQNNLPRCRISATTSPVRLFGIPISTFVPPCLSATVVIILGQNPK